MGWQEMHTGFPILLQQEGLACPYPKDLSQCVTTRASAEDWHELHQEASNLSVCTNVHWLPVGSTEILKPLLLMPESHRPLWSAESEAGTGEESTRAQAEKAPAGSTGHCHLYVLGVLQ